MLSSYKREFKLKYILSVYEDSYSFEASYTVRSDTPFPSMSVGDLYHSGMNSSATWSRVPGANECFRIKDIQHVILDSCGEMLSANTMVKLELVDRT